MGDFIKSLFLLLAVVFIVVISVVTQVAFLYVLAKGSWLLALLVAS